MPSLSGGCCFLPIKFRMPPSQYWEEKETVACSRLLDTARKLPDSNANDPTLVANLSHNSLDTVFEDSDTNRPGS